MIISKIQNTTIGISPEASAQQLCANRPRHWLDYVHYAGPMLAWSISIWDGLTLPPTKPGSSIDWNADAVRRILAD